MRVYYNFIYPLNTWYISLHYIIFFYIYTCIIIIEMILNILTIKILYNE